MTIETSVSGVETEEKKKRVGFGFEKKKCFPLHGASRYELSNGNAESGNLKGKRILQM